MTGHFEQHLRDAIALNRERAPRYAERSGGRSRRLSRALVASELVLLPVARWFDMRAAPYEAAGIPLMSSLFVPMSGAAEFTEALPPAPSSAPPPDPAAIRGRVAVAFADRKFAGAAQALDAELTLLEATPGTDCMVRHLLESARRIAVLAPHHAAAARGAALPDPTPLLLRLLRMHLWGLGTGALLDAWARPLQAAGIPILAQDLPPIPLPPGVFIQGAPAGTPVG